MKMTNTLETLDLTTLDHVTGGAFADKYVSTLKQDWKDIKTRSARSARARKQGHYGEAAKQYGAAILNVHGLAVDAIAPINAIRG
jgi:hypothetical protein